MNWRLLIAGFVFAGILIALVQPGRRALLAMQLNKGIYLTNLGKVEEAQTQLNKLEGKAGTHPKYIATRGELLARAGEYAQAGELLQRVESNPESQFWRAISIYNQDHVTTAGQLFRKLKAGETNLQSSYRQLVDLANVALGGGVFKGPLPLKPVFDTDVLNRTWLSLAGRYETRNRQWSEAARHYSLLARYGQLTSSDLSLACSAHLLAGEYSQAQLLAENTVDPFAFLEQLRRNLSGMRNDLQTTTTGLRDLQLSREMLSGLDRAQAWTEVQVARLRFERHEDLPKSGFGALSAGADSDSVLTMLSAELDELNGDYASAYLKYRKLYEASPNLSAYIRAADLAGETSALPHLFEMEAEHASIGQFFAAADLETTGGQLRNGYLVLHNPGAVTLEIPIESADQYTAVLIASASRAEGKGVLVEINPDGEEQTQEVYVPREGWDCYPLEIPMENGLNTIQFIYSAKADATRTEESRSLYIMGILISQKAAF